MSIIEGDEPIELVDAINKHAESINDTFGTAEYLAEYLNNLTNAIGECTEALNRHTEALNKAK
jgi:hypothetical protein